MDFSQLAAAFAIHTGITDEADPAELALWFNEAQLDLAWELAPVKKYQLEAKAGEAFIPPETWLSVIGADKDYHVGSDGAIIFDEAGPAELYYRELPLSFSGTDAAEESSLHQSLHYLLPLFAAARYWEKEAEGDSDEGRQASKWLSYYYQGKNLAKMRLFGINDPTECWKIRG